MALTVCVAASTFGNATTASAEPYRVDLTAGSRASFNFLVAGTGGKIGCNRSANTVSVSATAMYVRDWYNDRGQYIGSADHRYVRVGYELWGAPSSRPYARTKLRDVAPSGYGLGIQTRAGRFTVPNDWTIWMVTKGSVYLKGQDGVWRWYGLNRTVQVGSLRCTV